MDDLFSIILKAIATVIIVYAMMIPLFKHHNIINVIDGIFVFLSVVILLVFESTTLYLVFGIIMGVFIFTYLIIKFIVLKRLNDWYFIFHVTKKDKSVMEAEIQTMISETSIESDDMRFSTYPCLIQLSIQNRALRKKFLKEFEQIIKVKFNYIFGIRYGIFLMIFIILAVIWRY